MRIGKKHGDTEEEDDLEDFKQRPDSHKMLHVRQVVIAANEEFVFGVKLVYDDGLVLCDRLGHDVEEDFKDHKFDLEPEEYICGVAGRFGNICDRLEFTTSSGRTFSAGGTGGDYM